MRRMLHTRPRTLESVDRNRRAWAVPGSGIRSQSGTWQRTRVSKASVRSRSVQRIRLGPPNSFHSSHARSCGTNRRKALAQSGSRLHSTAIDTPRLQVPWRCATDAGLGGRSLRKISYIRWLGQVGRGY